MQKRVFTLLKFLLLAGLLVNCKPDSNLSSEKIAPNQLFIGMGTNVTNPYDDNYVNTQFNFARNNDFRWIRLFFPDRNNSNGPKDADARAARFVEIVNLAGSMGLKVMVVLMDPYFDITGGKPSPSECEPSNCGDGAPMPRWFGGAYRRTAGYAYVLKLIDKIGTNPNVFSYQIMNEGGNHVHTANNPHLYLKFISEVIKDIRKKNANVLVTPGSNSMPHIVDVPRSSPNYLSAEEVMRQFKNMDTKLFWTSSFYNFNAAFTPDLNLAKNAGVPIVLSEYGFCLGNYGGNPEVDAFQDTNYSLNQLFGNYGISGLAVWEAGDRVCGVDNGANGQFNILDEMRDYHRNTLGSRSNLYP